jgi:DNA repair exonuclease SbcCD ATPase subunit
MRLASIRATNFLRLVAIEITPDGAVVQISGANGSGKSSILRALECAFAGKDAVPADPVRHGAEEAEIVVDLGDLIVRRVIQPDRSTALTVTNKDGFKASSPQKLLEGLFGKLLDPVAFSRMVPKAQRELLADMVGLSTMLDDLWRADEADREKRRDVNRDLKAAEARLAGVPEIAAVDPVDVSATLAELRAARDHNTKVAQADADRERRRIGVEERRKGAAHHRAEAAKLIALAEKLEADATQVAQWLESADPIPAEIDTASIEHRLEQAEAINERHRSFQRRAQLAAEVAELRAMSETYTAELTTREAERRAVIEAAPLPIEGLGFGDDGITYNGVPFEQASTAEQLRVSAAIAMALSPKLRVLVIREGSLLDEHSLRMLGEMAEAQDFVCLVESVSTSGDVGIYIEDGQVAAINGVPVEQTYAA